jgi:anthranilate phosphoribosyltransferase
MESKYDLKDALNRIFSGEYLTKSEAKEVMTAIGEGKVDAIQTASFLTCFQMRAISGVELSGFREAMIDLAIAIDFSQYDTIDLCGTGGDGKDTFNISTLASFIVAGAGYKVSKHGNYGVSSGCGSSNVLEHLGYKFSNDQNKLQNDLEKGNFCYLHAPLFHPAMRHVGPVRKSLKVKTFFNILGPLLNPSKPKRQITGVFHTDLIPLYQAVFEDMGSEYAIVHSNDGYDEISLTGSFMVCTSDNHHTITPLELGLETIDPDDLHGGKSVEEASNLFLNILNGHGSTAQNNAACINAAYAIKLFKTNSDIGQCFDEAKDSLLSGRALQSFKTIIT